jgi:hypothetical protein
MTIPKMVIIFITYIMAVFAVIAFFVLIILIIAIIVIIVPVIIEIICYWTGWLECWSLADCIRARPQEACSLCHPDTRHFRKIAGLSP